MARQKPKSGLTSIQLPVEFVERTLDPILADKSLGYTSRTDVAKAAIRAFHDAYVSRKPATDK